MVRDAQRNVILSASTKISNDWNSLQQEVFAILFVVKLMIEHDFFSVIVESYCKTAVTLINGGEFNLWGMEFG